MAMEHDLLFKKKYLLHGICTVVHEYDFNNKMINISFLAKFVITTAI